MVIINTSTLVLVLALASVLAVTIMTVMPELRLRFPAGVYDSN